MKTKPALPCSCGCGQVATDSVGRNRGPENPIKHGHAFNPPSPQRVAAEQPDEQKD